MTNVQFSTPTYSSNRIKQLPLFSNTPTPQVQSEYAQASQYLKRLQQQPALLVKNVPQHPAIKEMYSLSLLNKHLNNRAYSKRLLRALKQCISQNAVLKYTTHTIEADFLDCVVVTEQNDELYISALSRSSGGTNIRFPLSQLVDAKAVAQIEAYDLFI